ncbi:MAG: hypothetical protein ING12_17355 [Roseomonas sp.]|nr:hypothetical protein [Roseomonas sp.]
MQRLTLRRQVAGCLIGINNFRIIPCLRCLMSAPRLQGDTSRQGKTGLAQSLSRIGGAFLADQRIGQDNPGCFLLRVARLGQQNLTRSGLRLKQGAGGQKVFRALTAKIGIIGPKRRGLGGQAGGFLELARLRKLRQGCLGLHRVFKLRKCGCHDAPQPLGIFPGHKLITRIACHKLKGDRLNRFRRSLDTPRK